MMNFQVVDLEHHFLGEMGRRKNGQPIKSNYFGASFLERVAQPVYNKLGRLCFLTG